jgi:hypothetical protein
VEPKESFGHLVGHFFADITHFDSKIFTTLKDLILRPGFLTREYAEGRRVQYLNPIRMYVFISAIFFLVLYTGKGEEGPGRAEINSHGVNLFRQQFADSLRGVAKNVPATGGSGSSLVVDSVRRVVLREVATRLDTAQVLKAGEESMSMQYSISGVMAIELVENKYQTVREFDSTLAKLPDSSRAGGTSRWILRNDLRLKEEHGGRSSLRIETNVQHTIPKLMFVLLPLFAFYVKLLYWRKKFVYSQYAIFSVHFHSFYFLVMLVSMLLDRIFDSIWAALWLPGLILVWAFVYLVASLRNMFGQSRWLSFLKAAAVTAMYVVTIIAALMLVMVMAFLRS